MTRRNRNKAIAVAVTVAVHAIVVILLIYMALTTPLPLPGEAGVEVNLGMYNEGMGTKQQPKPTKVVEAPRPKPEQVKEETVTQDTEEAPALEEKKPKKEEPKVNERALYKPTSKQTEQPSSEGNTETPGDQGNPNGSQDNSNYTGQGGAGGGPSFDLGGRGAKSLTRPNSDFKEEGRIVVEIGVDKAGRVVWAKIGKTDNKGNKTTISKEAMQKMALEAARSSVFVPDNNAADIQYGTITYNFVLK